MRNGLSHARLPTVALALTVCGQPLTIATWLNAEPGSEVSLRERLTLDSPFDENSSFDLRVGIDRAR